MDHTSSIIPTRYALLNDFNQTEQEIGEQFKWSVLTYQKNGKKYLVKKDIPCEFYHLKFNVSDNTCGAEFITQALFRESLGKKYIPSMLLVNRQLEQAYPIYRQWMLAYKRKKYSISLEYASNCEKPINLNFGFILPEVQRDFGLNGEIFLEENSPELSSVGPKSPKEQQDKPKVQAIKGIAKLLALYEFFGIHTTVGAGVNYKGDCHIMSMGSVGEFTNPFESINQLFEKLLIKRDELPVGIQRCYHFKKKKIIKALEKFSSLPPECLDSLAEHVKPLTCKEYREDYVNKIKLLQCKAQYLLTNHQEVQSSHIRHIPFYSPKEKQEKTTYSYRLLDILVLNDLFQEGFEESIILEQLKKVRDIPFANFEEFEKITSLAPALFSCWEQGFFDKSSFQRTRLAMQCCLGVLKNFLTSPSGESFVYYRQFFYYLSSEERQQVKHSKEDLFLLIDFLESIFNGSSRSVIFEEILTSCEPKLDKLPYLQQFLNKNYSQKYALVLFRVLIQIEDSNTLNLINRSIPILIEHFSDHDALFQLISKYHHSAELLDNLLNFLIFLLEADTERNLDLMIPSIGRFLKHHLPSLSQKNPKTKDIAFICAALMNAKLLTRTFEYDIKNATEGLEFWDFLEKKGTIKLLWTQDLESLHDNLQRLQQLFQLITDEVNHAAHFEANTLKALCFFIPQANPHFRLTDIETFDLVLYMLKSHCDAKGLKAALLFLDIFTPSEARKLYDFYLEQRKAIPPSSEGVTANAQNLPAISLSEFKTLPLEKQEEWAYYLSCMRFRDLQIAKWILRHRIEHTQMCLHALSWLSIVHKELPSREQKSVQEIATRHPHLSMRQAAIRCLVATCHQKENLPFKFQLIETIHSSLSEAILNCEQICLLLRSLSECRFNEHNDRDLLSELSQIFDHDQLKMHPEVYEALVLCCMRIIAYGKPIERKSLFEDHPFDRLLHQLKEIVEGPLWSKFDGDYALDKHSKHHSYQDEVPHLRYPIKENFEINRRRAMLGILDLWAELYKNLIPSASEEFNNPLYLDKLPDTNYYIPFVDFPQNWDFFRGIGTKQGQKVSQQAVLEALTTGCYTRNLDSASHNNGNWSKRKEHFCGTFFTPDLSNAEDLTYFNPIDGALIFVKAKIIRRDHLSLNLRIEKENKMYNVVSFGGKSRKDLFMIYLHTSWKKSLKLIAEEETLKQLTHLYDNLEPFQSEERKKLKKEISNILKNMADALKQDKHKAIFSTLSEQQIWEIHRSLTNQNYPKRVKFFKELDQPRSLNTLCIHNQTRKRLNNLYFIRLEYRKKFGTPFCLGQDEVLSLPNVFFTQQVENAARNLFTFHEKLLGFPPQSTLEEKIIDLTSFSQRVASAIDEDVLDCELLKFFRIALYFKDVPPNKLYKKLKKPSNVRFFGFKDSANSCYAIQTLVRLHQLFKSKRPEEEKMIFLKHTCHFFNKDEKRPQIVKAHEKLLSLFVE